MRTFASKFAEESFFLRRSLQEQRDSVSKSAEFRKEKENTITPILVDGCDIELNCTLSKRARLDLTRLTILYYTIL